MESVFYCDQCGQKFCLNITSSDAAAIQTAGVAGLDRDLRKLPPSPPVKCFWPDGSMELRTVDNLRGLIRNDNGTLVRPVAKICDISLRTIEHEPTRDRMANHFRIFGVHVLP